MCRPRSGGEPSSFRGREGRSVAHGRGRGSPPRRGRARSRGVVDQEVRAGRAQRPRVEAPGDARRPARPAARAAPTSVAESPIIHVSSAAGAEVAHQAEEAGGIGLARRHVARPPDPREPRGDAEALEDRAAEVAGLVGEHGEGRPRERVEGLRDAGVEARRVEEPLRVALEVDGQDLVGREVEPGVARGSARRGGAPPRRRRRGSPRAGSPRRRAPRARAPRSRRPRCRARSRRGCRRGRRRGAAPPGYPGPT